MSFPKGYKVGCVKGVLGQSPRVIACADSYYRWSLDRLFVQLMTGLGHGRVTAMQGGFSDDGIFAAPGPISTEDKTTSSNSINCSDANDYLIQTGEYFGLPVGGVQVIRFDGTTTFGANGLFAYVGVKDSIGGHEGDLFTDGDAVHCGMRLLYYCPADVADLNDRDIRIHDRQDISAQTIDAAANLATGSRKFHHLAEGDPDAATGGAPVAGQINAIYPDFVLDNPATGQNPDALFARLLDEDWQTANNAATPNTGKITPLAGAVIYEVDGSGDRVAGTYYQYLADNSWGFDDNWGNDAAGDATLGKQFNEAQLRHFLDVTTLDKTQPVLVIGSGDNENRDAADIQAGVEGWMSVFATALTAIGITDFHFLLVHSHLRQIGAETGQTLIDSNDKMGQAMYDAALTRSDCSFISVQKFLRDEFMGGGSGADDAVNALGLQPLAFGTVNGATVTGLNMLGDGSHFSDETSAAFMGAVIDYAMSPGMRLYDESTGYILASEDLPVDPATAFSFDVAALGLAEGSYTLGVTAVNAYGCESPAATVDVLIDSGGDPDTDFIDPSDVVAEVLAAGEVAVSWAAIGAVDSDAVQTTPAEFEVAEGGDLATVLETVAWNSSRVFRAEVGPFTNGASVTLNVRASDGVVSGLRGAWVAASAVVADSVGPDVPVIDEDALGGCDC